jgi:hypothetical protein
MKWHVDRVAPLCQLAVTFVLVHCGSSGSSTTMQPDGASEEAASDAGASADGQETDGRAGLDAGAMDGALVDSGGQKPVCQSGSDCKAGQLCVSMITCQGAGCPTPPSACADDPCDGGASVRCSSLCPTLCSGYAVCSLTADAGTLTCVNVPGGV